MTNSVCVEALEFQYMQDAINDFSSLSPAGELYFLYAPKGWRFRILFVKNNMLIRCFYGDLFDQKKITGQTKSKIIVQIKKLANAKKIVLFITKYDPIADNWPLHKDKVAISNFILNHSIKCNDDEDIEILEEFSLKHISDISKNLLRRPSLTKAAQEYISARSLGCCEYKNCARKLYINEQGVYGGYGTLAHIIAASDGGPRAIRGVSADEIRDPENLLYLCEEHHRLIDRVDIESHTIEVLRGMRDLRKEMSSLLSSQLSYEQSIPIVLEGDIYGVNTEITDREVLTAMTCNELIPYNAKITRIIKLKETFYESQSYVDYWNALFASKNREIKDYIDLLKNSSGIKLSIFALMTLPFLFLAGYITGEGRAIELFHRHRINGWAWGSNDVEKSITEFDINYSDRISANTDVVILLSITAIIDEDRIPDKLKLLPRIILNCQNVEIKQDPFNTKEDLNNYKKKAQQAVNMATDGYKAKTVHIIAIAPAIAVFILGQKFQRRSSPKITMYQIDRKIQAYPILNFDKNIVTLDWDNKKKLDI